MANYKVVYDGEEQDEVFSTYEEADEYGQYLVSCYYQGGREFELSNPGEYYSDPDEEPEYEVIETDEDVAEYDEDEIYFSNVVRSPGVFDDDGEYVRCPNCGTGLHYYNGEKTCPKCGPIE